MQSWLKTLEIELEKHSHDGLKYQFSLTEDEERQVHLPTIAMTSHGVQHIHRFSYEFFASHDYSVLSALGAELKGLLENNSYISRGEKRQSVTHFKDVMSWLMEEAKRGIQIQRYKGLGEMNPDQLWETTMDPSIRRMLEVKVEDAFAADQIFTTLMGDNVESRREFIESNALMAGNLDI
jgi:DNA gyrase subunit B